MATYKGHHFLDLAGPDGNAFALMGHAQSLGRQIGMITGEIEMMLNDMRSGDYDHLVSVFDKHFGSVVELTNRP